MTVKLILLCCPFIVFLKLGLLLILFFHAIERVLRYINK